MNDFLRFYIVKDDFSVGKVKQRNAVGDGPVVVKFFHAGADRKRVH
jgi:hypothetical protein